MREWLGPGAVTSGGLVLDTGGEPQGSLWVEHTHERGTGVTDDSKFLLLEQLERVSFSEMQKGRRRRGFGEGEVRAESGSWR